MSTPKRAKYRAMFATSRANHSSLRGWSNGTACAQSMIHGWPSHSRRLYSLRSPWTSLAFRIAAIEATTSSYVACASTTSTFRITGAGIVSSPRYCISSRFLCTASGWGTRTPASCMRTRFLYSFCAHTVIIPRKERPVFLNLGSPMRYSRSDRNVAVFTR